MSPDSFKKALEEVTLHGQKNGGVTSEGVLKVVYALEQTLSAKLDDLHTEIVEVGNEVKTNRSAVTELFDKHVVTYIHMTPEQFQTWVSKYGTERDLATHKLIEAHIPTHRETDPSLSDYRDERTWMYQRGPKGDKGEQGDQAKQVWFMWMLGNKIVAVLIAVTIAMTIWGLTFWADSCASKKAEERHEPVPVVTVTASPTPMSSFTAFP